MNGSMFCIRACFFFVAACISHNEYNYKNYFTICTTKLIINVSY